MSQSRGPWVMGISASHNGAACLLHGDKVVVAIQEERLTRLKRQRVFGAGPALSILYCMKEAGIRASDLDLVVLCTQGRGSTDANNILLNPLLRPEANKLRVARIPHHLGHAISVFALSGFSESAVLVIDGMGSQWNDLSGVERASARRFVEDGFEIASLYYGDGPHVRPVEKYFVPRGEWLVPNGAAMPTFGSLGGIFAAVSKQIFGSPAEPGKVMGLAAFGQQQWKPEDFFAVTRDGLSFLDRVPRLFQFSERWPEHSEIYKDLACSAQGALEAGALHLATRLKTLTGSSRLCYSGGVALNGIANERLFAEAGFDEIFIAPAAEDSGTAIGAAYWGLWQLCGKNSRQRLLADALGRSYRADEVENAAALAGSVNLVSDSDYISATVDLLCDGRIVGWFAGGAELGPRALGQRSILCDPRREDLKGLLNARVKRREAFRPFAPAILREDVPDWFETTGPRVDSPFMLRVRPFKLDRRAQVPAVTHVDGTGRLQTVSEESNGDFYRLIRAFKERTGVPILLNTSFNGRAEPIVETPLDALRCMLANELDCCVFPGLVAIAA